MLKKIVQFFGGDPHKREVQKLLPVIDRINSLEPAFEKLSAEQLLGKTAEFRQRLEKGETLDDLLPEAFAAVREASKRTIGLRHFDVQLIGGMTLHKGKIAEMRTGEGKTLVATLPLYLNALSGKGAHLVTVNDYLARRDARWMGPIFHALGMKVGVLQMAARTENGRKAFVYNPERKSPIEDQHQLDLVERAEAYKADITYGTNSEFGFDYLRDNLTMNWRERSQRCHNFAIVDEVDSILIDEARTPLIISGPADENSEWYIRMAQVVKQLAPEDYEVEEKDHTVSLTEIGEVHVEALLGMTLRDPDRPEDITPEQARLMGFLEQALRAQFLFRRNKEYLVQSGKVVIVDEHTGRLMPGRRWSDGLHQAVEAKEGVKVEAENITYATITLQNFFRMYAKLSGMTGTALTESEEFYKIYKLDVLPIPTNLDYRALSRDGKKDLVEVQAKDEEGYKYAYFALASDPDRKPVYYRRKDYTDVVYRTEEAKLRAIMREIIRLHILGRPQLVGTASVEHSERLSNLLRPEPIRRLFQVQLIRRAYFIFNKTQETEQAIKELLPLNRPLGDLEAPELRKMGRGWGLESINPEDPANLSAILELLALDETCRERLVSVLQAGVPHQVLNARKHDEESVIIARAGGFGMVTIATNMAGRGVDIKLGGELREDITADILRILGDRGYDMLLTEREEALRAIPESEYGIYAESVQAFFTYMNDMRRVRELGGLHVLGSERHEARRIDNQLRGRAARQGDPGSSRFYLSMQDELFRLFGGSQAEAVLNRFNLDESFPIEMGLVGRLIENSQNRVEGANFDIRKHLLEYDDVLNTQRKRIYDMRDRIYRWTPEGTYEKEDLREDVGEMLRTEMQKRVPEALADEQGPWRLLAYLNEIQPMASYPDRVLPSFTITLLLEELNHAKNAAELRSALLKVTAKAVKAETEYLQKNTHRMLDKSMETVENQIEERLEALDNFFDSLKEADREDEEGNPLPPRRAADVQAEMGALVHLPLRLSPEQFRQLEENSKEVREDLREQVRQLTVAAHISRAVQTVEARLGADLGIKVSELQHLGWDEAAGQILLRVEELLAFREEKLLGESGAIARDLDNERERLEKAVQSDIEKMRLMGIISQGARVSFDSKTHRRFLTATTRLRYEFAAAHHIEKLSPDEVTARVLAHLEEIQERLCDVLGEADFFNYAQSGVTVGQFGEKLTAALGENLTPEYIASIAATPLAGLGTEDAALVQRYLGRRQQNEIYRTLLLRAISERWMDYLTRMEALRVSIGMEAYAQRDPLVQYKSKASVMFSELLGEVRSEIINRMFSYRVNINMPAAARPSPRSDEKVSATEKDKEKGKSPAKKGHKSGKR
ncbi:MAG TPA: hypothetical protein PKW33_06490 [Anaerolineaceae bacterium]|mgnify:CR=1 FL=1|nr:hypothetical protein [Anaerolineaceae bacterium]HPN51216.1 hypothetical protein [Anaerolineaceae bacterium]